MNIRYKFKDILNLNINKLQCKYYLSKNGKIKFLPKIYDSYLCMIDNINLISIITFPYLYDKDEDSIIKKLVILYIIQKKEFKYIKINKFITSSNNYEIYLFDESKKDVVLEIMFFSFITKTKEMDNYYYGTRVNSLSTSFMIHKLLYNMTNKDLLIFVFFSSYIQMIRNNIYYKYNKELNDFRNYNYLYIFLKKNGYVDKYYNFYAVRMIKNFNKFYKKIINHPEIKEFKNQNKQKIKDFKKINLIKLIDKYVNNKFNKENIKNKFIQLIEKYNI
jgi:hypothetical protein